MNPKKPTKPELLAGYEKLAAKNSRLKKKYETLSTKLTETNRLYHSLVDLSPEAIILHDEGIITYANAAALELLNIESQTQLIGSNVMDYVPAEYREIIRDKIKTDMESFSTEPLCLKAKRKDGAEFYLESLASAIKTGKGKSVQVLIRDVTKQKVTELELRKANRALEALSAINQTLIRAENEENFLNDVCRIICDIGGYLMAWIGYKQKDKEKTVKPVVWKGVEEGYLSLIKVTADEGQYSFGPAGVAIRTGQTQVVQNLEAEWANPAWKEAAAKRGYRSIIALPVKTGTKTIGAVAIYSENNNSFDKEETALLERISDDISFGITTLRAKVEKDKAEQFLIESEDRYRSLIELSPEAIIVHTEGKVMYANNSTLKYLCAANKEELIGKSMADLMPGEYKEEIHEKMRRAKEMPGIVDTLQMKFLTPKGNPMYLEAVGAPVKYLGKPAGQVIIRDITARKLYEEELSNSREQLRSLAAHLQDATETERARLAREMHDELGQYLTGLKMDISFLRDTIEETVEGDNRNAILERIDSASELLNTTVHSVRKLSADLRPAVLDSLGLLAAIEWQAEEFQNRMGIACSCFLTVEEVSLPPDHTTAIFRIFQESLTNIAKHSHATRVSIEFGKENNFYLLEIKDNGKGISEEDKAKVNSFGLLGIRERTYLFGGSTEITGLPGKGTTVRVTIPI